MARLRSKDRRARTADRSTPRAKPGARAGLRACCIEEPMATASDAGGRVTTACCSRPWTTIGGCARCARRLWKAHRHGCFRSSPRRPRICAAPSWPMAWPRSASGAPAILRSRAISFRSKSVCAGTSSPFRSTTACLLPRWHGSARPCEAIIRAGAAHARRPLSTEMSRIEADDACKTGRVGLFSAAGCEREGEPWPPPDPRPPRRRS